MLPNRITQWTQKEPPGENSYNQPLNLQLLKPTKGPAVFRITFLGPFLEKKRCLVNVLETCFLRIYSYGIHFSGRSEKDFFIHSKTVSARNTTQKWWMLVLENNFLKVFCKKDTKNCKGIKILIFPLQQSIELGRLYCGLTGPSKPHEFKKCPYFM